MGTTPLLRWQRDIEHIRQLPPATDLRRLFFHRLDRLVRRDCTFLLQNRFYEAPPHLAGETIEVRFDPLDAAAGGDLVPGQTRRRRRGWSIPSSTASCLPPNRPQRPHPNPPASTSSNCSISKKDDEEESVPW